MGITFHKDNVPVAKALKSHISKQCGDPNACSIFVHPRRKACYFSIHSWPGLAIWVNYVNGKLRTPKAYQLGWVIGALNKKSFKTIALKPICNNNLLSDAWLAGFIDADGGFAVRQTIAGVKQCVECQMILVQRATYKKTNQSFKPLFSEIAEVLQTKINNVAPRSKAHRNTKLKCQARSQKPYLGHTYESILY